MKSDFLLACFMLHVSCFMIFGCATSSDKELVLSESQEYYAGRAAAAKTLSTIKIYNSEDPELLQYITLIGYTLALESNRAELFQGYNFAIVEDDNINAFSFPSGFIFVTTGAILNAKNEDELAAVIAHEIAHVNKRHPEVATLNELKKRNVAATLSKAAGWGMKIVNILRKSEGKEEQFTAEQIEALSGALGGVADAFGSVVKSGYDRDQELEADALGIEILARSGYDPMSIITYLERLGPQSSGVVGWLNASHPKPEERIENLRGITSQNGFARKDPSARVERFRKYTAKLMARAQ